MPSKKEVDFGDNEPDEVDKRRIRSSRIRSRAAAPLIQHLSAAELIERLEEYGGDIFGFTLSMGRINGTREMIISKTLSTLNKPENAQELQRWNDLIQQFAETQMIIQQRKALKVIKGMPKPAKDAPLAEWIKYATFWGKVDTGLEKTSGATKNAGKEAQEQKAMVEKMIYEMNKNKEGK